MGKMQIINDALLADLYKQADGSERKRMNYDLRTSSADQSQRMLNAMRVGTQVPIHLHEDTTETVICLEGRIEEILYEEIPGMENAAPEKRFKEIERVQLCPGEGTYGVQIPKGVWHTVEVLESSVIFEAKDGAFKPR